MQIKRVNSLLTKLVDLTSEREELALESALVKTLTDIIITIHGNNAKPVVIFYIKEDHLPITAVSQDGIIHTPSISEELKLAITNCYKSGVISTFLDQNKSTIKLYPVRNLAGEVASIISIEDPLLDDNLDAIIVTLLQLYQNFTKLINDNESDTLTGLLNRKTFDIKINKVLTQKQSTSLRKDDKANQYYFLAIFDIDHFKHVNDEFGHLIGDEVLLMFAQLMRQSVRETDPIFRFGGEEFVGVFECAKSEDVIFILERFRNKVEQFNFPQVGKITVSIGYSEIQGFDTSSQIIDRADSSLYFAKNNGRNQVACFEQLLEKGLLEQSKKEGDIEFF